MHQKTYVIRTKIVKIKPTPIPETTYKPENLELKPPPPPIKSTPFFEEFSKPKPQIVQEEIIDEIPKYERQLPKYDPVDIRVNAATIERDGYLQRIANKKQQIMQEEEPTEFLNWQNEMKQKDEEVRKVILQKRHNNLNYVRKKAMKSKLQKIEERLNEGNLMRQDLREKVQKARQEIEDERERIRELKNRVDNVPMVLEKLRQNKKEIVNQIKNDIRKDLRSARRRQKEEYEIRRINAEKVRYDAIHHTNRHGDSYIRKKEITETKFLSALSDKETKELLIQNKQKERELILSRIEAHKKLKEEKIERLYSLLEEELKARDLAEIEHKRQREEKKRLEEEEALRKKQEEEEKILKLEKKLEKKRQARIKEAEEMEERTRQIAARNRYLALNKRAIETKSFQSQQDAKLRMARERQESKIQKPLKPSPQRKKKESELIRLKSILGI